MNHSEIGALCLLGLCFVMGVAGIIEAVVAEDSSGAMWFYFVTSASACSAALLLFSRARK
ncbi:hypothetical protein ACMDCR_18430 [Labrys okinawensis]|uniref:hypothetical protein n=1 Tax=Labrys okinawensis TaxID=346911 RepID=UPI0039BD932F